MMNSTKTHSMVAYGGQKVLGAVPTLHNCVVIFIDSLCKIYLQTDKMPENDSNNKIIKIKYEVFHL